MEFWVAVVVATPAHSGVAQRLTYRSERLLAAGSLVRVPQGTREVLGIVWGEAPAPETDAQRAKTKGVTAALEGILPLDAAWRALLEFSSRYYQRGIGEVALAALPPQLRELDADQLARRQQMQVSKQAKLVKAAAKASASVTKLAADSPAAADAVASQSAAAMTAFSLRAEPDESVQLSEQQSEVIAQFFADEAAQPALLFGTTGSGKTEVYLRCAARVLEGAVLESAGLSQVQSQVLVMVPEINLTPQLEARFIARFAPLYGAAAVVSMHSGMTPAQRLKSWLAAHTGQARIVLGTRMSIFASMPGLRLIIVDEEHDPSYKSQDGARHSARDLAVMRAKLQTAHAPSQVSAHGSAQGMALGPCRVLLGSATPSLETWHACESGRYQRLHMPQRVGGGALAALRLVDMRTLPKKTLFAPTLLAAIAQRIARGEQSLIFLNRRGYAPVLACGACEWKSDCPHCSAYRVFHKIDRTLRCHHCGTTDRVPRACPSCGNIDIAPIGRGTEKLEEQLAQALGIRAVVQAAPGSNEFTGMGMAVAADAPVDGHSAELLRPDGRPAVIARMDADTTRLKGSLEQQLAHVHNGDVDVLVGTQMIAKGHDFRRITLVAAINPDSALYSSDFRAPERLFSLLMQAAGRAGRDAALQGAQMWLQTQHPDHPLFAALKAHDYPSFASQQLAERTQAGLPPMSYQALIRAEAKSQDAAQDFLRTVSEAAIHVAAFEHVTLYPCVPMTIQRVANVERAQMLVESSSRAALQKFLSDWQSVLRSTKVQGLIRWAMDVDPLLI